MSHLHTPLFFIASLLCFACSPRLLDKAYNEARIKQLYTASIADAALPEPNEISTQLQAIIPQNANLKWKKFENEDYVLVTTWISDSTFFGNIKPDKSPFPSDSVFITWVTLAPEMQEQCRDPKFGKKEGLNLRVKQLLGMPPTAVKTHVAELWVKPGDLFRPCPDKEVYDSQCGLYFTLKQDTTQVQKKPYMEWFNDQRLMSYYNFKWEDQHSWTKHYPWTQLGYTYDWNPKNKTHVGLSEFIIKNNSKIYPHAVYTTEAYCDLDD